MGITDWLLGRRPSDVPSEPAVPPQNVGRSAKSDSALVQVSGTSGAQMGFMDSASGNRSLTWASYHAPIVSGGYFGTAPGSEISRERSTSAAVTADMLTSDPTIASLVELFAVYGVGQGLTLSSRPDYAALGITPEAARDLAGQIERAWQAWIMNPLECDASGRHTMHQLATAAFKSWLISGETLAILDWRTVPGARTKTKLCLLDSRQLDQSITRTGEGGASIMQGVQFSKDGALQGYWLREAPLGDYNSARQARFVLAKTSWGRQRVLHIWDLLLPGQVRGLSPLIASLTSAKSKALLREYGLAAALIQTMVAATIESDLPSAQAYGSINTDLGVAHGETPDEWTKAHSDFYENFKLSFEPGRVGHLLKGDKLRMHRAEAPNATFEAFDAAMGRTAAKAAGSSAEDVSGDFSRVNFSAARLALELPWRINLRRRSALVEPLYRATYATWMEEMCETGKVALPENAPAFLEAKAAYCASEWRGSSKPVADVYKQTLSDVMRLEHGLATYSEILGESGKDFEAQLAERASEKQQVEKAGFTYPTPKAVLAYGPEQIVAESDKD